MLFSDFCVNNASLKFSFGKGILIDLSLYGIQTSNHKCQSQIALKEANLD